jgi:hypothetical protein
MEEVVSYGERMLMLARTFPTLRRKLEHVERWDPIAFATSAAPWSGGEKDAALFVLSVWDPATDWSEFGLERDGKGRFEVHVALGNWDPAHRAAFVTWASRPWWP